MSVLANMASAGDSRRNLVVVVFFAIVALAAGAFVVVGTAPALLLLTLGLLATIAAFTVPLNSLPIILAALVPFQFYFFIPGTNFAAPAAVIFVGMAAARVLLTHDFHGQVWLVPVAVFLAVASIAAFGASSRYEAFKGIYEWLPIFASALVAAQAVDSEQTVDRMTFILIGLGLLQALLGLVEYVLGMDRVLAWLSAPLAEFVFPPNLLRERLSDLSFNWNLSGRALPFGTFINGIDYAIFLAALDMLAWARALTETRRRKTILWLASALVIAATVLLTLKGSGLLALAAGVLVLAICFKPNLSREMRLVLPAAALIVLMSAWPFVGSISERAAFLIQRETSDSRELGRLRIWGDRLPAWVDRPWFGYGLNNSPAAGEVLRTLRYGAFGTYPVSPESAYVQALLEMGAIGFIALMSLIGLTIARAVKIIRAQMPAAMPGILSALVALWAGNLTVSAFTTDPNGMLMGLLIGLVFSKWNR